MKHLALAIDRQGPLIGVLGVSAYDPCGHSELAGERLLSAHPGRSTTFRCLLKADVQSQALNGPQQGNRSLRAIHDTGVSPLCGTAYFGLVAIRATVAQFEVLEWEPHYNPLAFQLLCLRNLGIRVP